MYLLGIAVTYSLMGVVAALTGQVFGSLLQNAWVLVGIAGIMVALALSLFGVYQIQAPNFIRQKVSGDTGGGVLGALSMGLVVGIVAAPCVGPVTIGLLTYVGATGSPWVGFWMFFTLSLGLGIPYVALGTFSGGLQRLPRSGVWMLWVEKLFGFAMLGLALYFIAPLFPDGVVPWMVLALALVSGVWLGWLDKDSSGGTTFNWFKKATGLAALAVGVFAVIPATPGVGVAWQDYDPALFDQAREEGRPVLLDFTADWCIPCRELDRFTFSDEEVIAAVDPFLTLKIDLTHLRVAGKPGRCGNDLASSGFLPSSLLMLREGKCRNRGWWATWVPMIFSSRWRGSRIGDTHVVPKIGLINQGLKSGLAPN